MSALLPMHEVIEASAGSGKTFQLAHRYLRLMAAGVPADRICALTFSRKAAGEIFESIVGRLCRAAELTDERRLTAELIGDPTLSRQRCIELLRAFVTRLNRLHIGTLDSFMVGVVRAFPLELGVPTDFRVMDSTGPEARELQREVLARVMDPAMSDAETRKELLDAFRQATFGRDEKSFGDKLEGFIDSLRDHYRVTAAAELWGDAGVIWPDGCDWVEGSRVSAAEEAAALLEAMRSAQLPEKAIARWQGFAEAAVAHVPGMPLRPELLYLLPKLEAALPDLRAGGAEIATDRQRYHLDAGQCRRVLVLLKQVVRAELVSALESTRGIYRVLRLFESLYDDTAHRRGTLSFSDAQFVLTKYNRASGGVVLSRRADEAGRLYIDYRLDCSLDHWLLDEFQDTSDLQWSALENLADEILQDTTGTRTFFYVGDVKQAIYAWRGGNPRLFGSILDRYRPRITPRGLHVSYRSVPAVIDTVNTVFDNLSESGLPAGATSRWADIWSRHRSSPHLESVPGYACVIEPDCGGGEIKPGAEDRHKLAAALIRRLAPVERGLSVAVLVRNNAGGRAVVDCLRRECPGIPVVHEGNATICDNPVVAALLSLLRYAAHPGDLYAERHICMTPLRAVIDAAGWTMEELVPVVLSSVEEGGFGALIAEWGARLADMGVLDDFGRLRLGDLLGAAAEFDRTGEREVSSFLRFAEAYQVRESSSRSPVRVMTIHQSKGLGFDVVVLPELMSRSMAGDHDADFLTRRDELNQQPLWTLKAPRRGVAALNETLATEFRRMDEDSCFEALCVLYVAMTRPRRALYMITSFPGKTSKALNEAALLKRQLVGKSSPGRGLDVIDGLPACTLFESGDRCWAESLPDAAGEEPEAEPVSAPPVYAPVQRLIPVEPSTEEEVSLKASRLFASDSRDIVTFGSEIHKLLERVEWVENAAPASILEDWRRTARGPRQVLCDVERQFEALLASPDAREVLSRPPGVCALWREKRFEIVLPGNRWVSGTFDRVVITGRRVAEADGATILDYKSSLVECEEDIRRRLATYRPQLALYAQVLSAMLGLEEDRIARQILFTRTGAVRDG